MKWLSQIQDHSLEVIPDMIRFSLFMDYEFQTYYW